ncbi:hypothetical protein ASG52_07165 [Methylobacterium sp. Leaf456]|uniref:hypothetical protein n=1 Tax=Methylobacterium sp. Leaf456 TaxID=1736382 RepID=UPI0006F7F0F4|nr:hypothetical protein [Methylobacterium sp. Leaf456]KQT50581.1 hypothetical protein ASG52_07165 [Methylobacterium sp. Leaf456]
MSLDVTARAYIERIMPILMSRSADEIARGIDAPGHSPLRDEVLALGREGRFSAFYAPFDWINEDADVVIVGATPGKRQAKDALLALRSTAMRGASVEEAAAVAKSTASFAGMRDLGARLMDHLDLHQVFGLRTTADLFGCAAGRVHSTSVLRYPILDNGVNFSGDERIMARPLMRRMVEENLVPELARLPNAWIVPFGVNALLVLEDLAARGLVDGDRLLGGVLHPSGRQWNRYKVQLGITTGAAVQEVPGGAEVLRRSNLLRDKVRGIVSLRSAA